MKFTDRDKNLTILQEECAEIVQVVSKIRRFGMDCYHPKKEGVTNRDHLVQEMGDVVALMGIVCATEDITWASVLRAAEEKVIKLNKWY